MQFQRGFKLHTDGRTQPRSEVRPGVPLTDAAATVRVWTRVIAGVRYSFRAVTMVDGERRYIVSRYNGYSADDPSNGMRFGCAWDQVHWFTVKPRGYVIDISVTDNPLMDDQWANVYVDGSKSPKLLVANRMSGGGGVYLMADSTDGVPAMDAPHWRALAVKLAKHVGVSGRARIQWTHEGPGRQRGRSYEFDV